MKRFATTQLLITILGSAQALTNYQRLNIPKSISTNTPSHLSMRMNPSSFEGTSYTITEFPRPALRRVPNANIEVFDDALAQKCSEMITIMYAATGVGLAAPQIGLNENLFVYNPTGDKVNKNMERIVCNPTIAQYSPEIVVQEEACLSLRSDYVPGQVARAEWIQVEYQNELGQLVKRRLKGFEARVFQHEYDHLKGILCWDRFPPEDREAVQENINKLLGLYPEDDAIIEPPEEPAKNMQPPPLSAKRMPPLDLPKEEDDDEITPAKKTTLKPKSGFGGGGGGGGKKNANKKKKKK